MLSAATDAVLCPNGLMDQDETWHAGRPRPGHILLDGDPVPLPKGHTPQFSAHMCCGQIAGWIKIPLGMKVDFGLCDFVLHGDPGLPPQKRGGAFNFQPISIVAKRLYGSR